MKKTLCSLVAFLALFWAVTALAQPVTKRTININFGSTVSGTDLSGVVPIKRDNWNNVTSGTSLSDLKMTKADGTTEISTTTVGWDKGLYGPGGYNPTDPILTKYLDDGNGATTTVSFTNIPFTKYRVIVIRNSDNKSFAPTVVNGVSYSTTTTAESSTPGFTIKGTENFGKTLMTTLIRGVNYIISEPLNGVSNLTVASTRVLNSSSRGGIAAIQIVEVDDNDGFYEPLASIHTATLAAGENSFSSLAFTPALPTGDLSKVMVRINATANATLDMSGVTYMPKAIEFTGSGEVTLKNYDSMTSTVVNAIAPLALEMSSLPAGDYSGVNSYSTTAVENFFATRPFHSESTFAQAIKIKQPNRRLSATYDHAANLGLVKSATTTAARSINLNFNSNVSGTATSGAFPIVRDNWNNQTTISDNNEITLTKGVNADGTAWTLPAGVKSNLGIVSGGWNYAASTDDVLKYYIDEGAGKPNPGYTLTGIPFTKYRVISIHQSDNRNGTTPTGNFGYVTIGGTNYCSPNATLSPNASYTQKGNSAWGMTIGATCVEGVNYVVSDPITTSSVTVTGNRLSATTRGCLAAVQIIEVVPRDARAELGVYINTAKTWQSQIGTLHGQIIANSVTADFLSALTSAEVAFANASLTENDYDVAYFNLFDAVAPMASQPRNVTIEKDTKWYYIQTASHSDQPLHTNLNNTNINFTTLPSQPTLDFLFQLKSTTGDNFSIVNALFGEEGGINAPNNSSPYSYVMTGQSVLGTITPLEVENGYPQFSLSTNGGKLHAQTSGSILVRWDATTPAAGNSSAWKFNEFSGTLDDLVAATINSIVKTRYDLYVDASGNPTALYPIGTAANEYSISKFNELKAAWTDLSAVTTYDAYKSKMTIFNNAISAFVGSKNPPIATDTYYYIKPYGGGKRGFVTIGTTTLTGGGVNQASIAEDADANNLKQAWKLVRHSSFKGAVFQNAYTGEYLNTEPTHGSKKGSATEPVGILFTASTNAQDNAADCFYMSSVTNDKAYVHLNASATDALYVWVDANTTDNCSWKFEQFAFTTAPLSTMIAQANALLSGAAQGENTGEYSATSIEAFQTAINTATATTATTIEEVVSAMQTLDTAIATFKASVIGLYPFNGTLSGYYSLKVKSSDSNNEKFLSNPRDVSFNDEVDGDSAHRPHATLVNDYEYTRCAWLFEPSATTGKYIIKSNLFAGQYIDELGCVRPSSSYGDNEWTIKTLFQTTPTWDSSSSLLVIKEDKYSKYLHHAPSGDLGTATLYTTYQLANNTPVKVDSNTATNPIVENRKVVYGNRTLKVYTLTGVEVQNKNLKAGVYVVKAGDKTFKVSVK